MADIPKDIREYTENRAKRYDAPFSFPESNKYNVNQHTGNNKFVLLRDEDITETITIPYGNYSVYTFMEQLNSLLAGLIKVSYNVATNTYT